MSSKRVRIILLSGFVAIALSIGISLILTYRYQPPTYTALPDTGSAALSGSGSSAGASTDNRLENVTVTSGNVQTVIEKTLHRPYGYSRNIAVETYFSNGEKTVCHIAASVKGSATAMKIDGPGYVKYLILTGDKLYIWYEGDTNYRVGPSDSLGKEPNLSDEFQMVITYEDILELDKNNIIDAGFISYGGEDCIYVKYVSGALAYTTTAYISVSSGLLIGAEQYDGAEHIYSMTTSDFNQTEPGIAAFSLPGGKNALSAP